MDLPPLFVLILKKGGLRIYTTFDPLPWLGLYKLLEKVLANRLKKKSGGEGGFKILGCVH